jgi:hypothetical protein
MRRSARWLRHWTSALLYQLFVLLVAPRRQSNRGYASDTTVAFSIGLARSVPVHRCTRVTALPPSWR